MRIVTFVFLSALVWLSASMAQAADCSLNLVNTVPIKTANDGRRAVVPVTINGTQKQFLLDTGGAMTQISAAAAEDLKLPKVDSGVKMLDLYGNASTSAAQVDTLVLGHLRDRNTTLPIMTFKDNDLYSGILAADYMGRFDIELNFAGGKMNYFSPDHCEGEVVYWPAAAIAAVPMRFVDHHLILDVTLDGHNFKAMIDTGAPVTTLTMAQAKRVFGITAKDADKPFEHVFEKLSFEGLAVSNPHVVIIADKTGSRDPNNSLVTGSLLRRIDDADTSDPVMLIGMNILSKLRLYIAFNEQKIYITPASALQAAKPSP